MSANLIALLLARHAPHADKVAVVWQGKPWCRFGDLPARIGRYRAALDHLGVARGDRVMVKCANSPEFVVCYLAVLAAGAVFVPLNPAYTAAEVAHLIEDAAPVLLIHAATTALPAPDPALPLRRITLEADGSGDLPALAAGLAPLTGIEHVEADTLAALLFTSGTTGRPKGAMLSHGNLASNVVALHALWRFSEADTVLHALPLFHVHGLFVAVHLALYSAATLDMLPRFDADAVVAALPRATVLMGVPTFYARLLDHPGFTRALAARLRLFISGSAPLLPSVFAAFEALTGTRILERYGMTEALMITSNPYDPQARIAGTVGMPLPGVEVRVVDAARAPVAPGVPGAIEIRGPNVCQGYWRRADATAEAFRDEGWFLTGDTGFLDEHGRLSIAGRSKDLIIAGGLNIYPAEIETLIADVPGIADVAVFGVPHPDLGEAVVAAITLDGTAFDRAALDAAIGAGLARFKQPRAIHVLDAFPRNAMGKILKAELRARFAGLFTPSGAG